MWLATCALAAPAPTRATSLRVEVTGPVAELTWTRSFHHDGPEPIDAELWFAVPPAAVVDALVVTVGDRRVESRVVDRAAAREQYVRAADAGRAATLLEAADGDLMVQRVANVMPGDDVEVELHLVQTVARAGGAWELVVPLTVAPRLQDPGGEGPVYLVAGPDADPRSVPIVERVDAEIVVHSTRAVQWLESRSHPYRTTLDGPEAVLRVEGAPANRDLVVGWATALQDPALSLWVAGDHALLQLEAPAPWARATPPPQDLIVLVDASDTMVGRWPRVTHAVLELLAGLRPDDRLTVLVFADSVRGLGVRVAASPEGVSRALYALDQVPLGGGTNLELGLRFAAAVPVPPDRRRTVVVVTDGGADGAGVHAPAGATVHTLGLGAATHRGLLDRLAREGGGVSVTLRPEDDLVEALRPLLAALPGPVLTDVVVPFVTAPRVVPPLYAGRAVAVAAEGVPCAPIVVTGRFAGAPFERVVTPRCTPRDRAIDVTWARLRMEDDPATARDVALKYQVASPWTSVVGADEAVVNPGGLARVTSLALDAPADFAGETQELMVMASAPAVAVDEVGLAVVPEVLATRLPARPALALAAAAAPSAGASGRFVGRVDGVEATDLVAGALAPAPLDGLTVSTT
ncbi:MAG: VIT and VWA domain-containing protein, partial [Myxococcota bacterium]